MKRLSEKQRRHQIHTAKDRDRRRRRKNHRSSGVLSIETVKSLNSQLTPEQRKAAKEYSGPVGSGGITLQESRGYIVEGSTKYHLHADCPSLTNKTSSIMSISEAEKQGLTLCKRCEKRS